MEKVGLDGQMTRDVEVLVDAPRELGDSDKF